jgi:hypothetical protein
MKVLLLHPADPLRQRYLTHRWDWVVDLGRAPASTYDRWRQQANCRVTSLYDMSVEIEDLYCIKQLLQLATGAMVDRWGIDWWDLLSLEIQSDVHQFILVNRLSKELGPGCEIYSSRCSPLAAALGDLLGTRPTVMSGGLERALRRIQHYHQILSGLDPSQVAQVLEDKLQGRHSFLQSFVPRRRSSMRPVVLLPSAYINVSRTALAYAALLPDKQFLLVINRTSAKPPSLPANVGLASLTSYRGTPDRKEMQSLLNSWHTLHRQLTAGSEEFRLADAAGILARIPKLLDWGIGLRDAWIRVFESEEIVACLSADDSNPPSSIPLLLAKARGLPALACHHGALNYHMALKANHADSYLVKSEMERDYLRLVARVPARRIIRGGPKGPDLYRSESLPRSDAPGMVFFTEPYQALSWRADEIYADLLPRLWALAQDCGLKLVLKLHPFESAKERRRTVNRHLGAKAAGEIGIISGPPSSEVWCNTRFALTVQSSVALECNALGIPVFLLSWLRDHYSGYVSQYARFGIGRVLDSPEQISEIPHLLATCNPGSDRTAPWATLDSGEFERLLSGTSSAEKAGHDEELESFSHSYTA